MVRTMMPCSSVVELEQMELSENTLDKMQSAVRTLISHVGEDPTREGLVETPRRVAKAWLDMTSGGDGAACQKAFGQALFHEPLLTASPDGIVLVRDISFASLSQELLLPFHGRCHIAYIPSQGIVLGLSKLARATRCLSGRMQSLDQLVGDLMTAVQQEINPKGILVIADVTQLGGSGRSGAPVAQTTSAACGCFAEPASGLCEEVRLMLSRGGSSNSATSSMAEASPACGCCVGDNGAHTVPTPPIGTGTASPVMEAAVEELLRGIGENPERMALSGAARRYVSWLQGATAGYSMPLPPPCAAITHSPGAVFVDPGAITPDAVSCDSCSDDLTVAPALPSALGEGRHMLATSEIGVAAVDAVSEVESAVVPLQFEFTSLCEHHLLPFYGSVKVACVLPAGFEAGAVSAALSQIVEVFSRRLQVQERLTQQIADAAAAAVGSGGAVLVLCESAHMCMVARGVEEHASATLTTAARGRWAVDSAARSRALKALLDST